MCICSLWFWSVCLCACVLMRSFRWSQVKTRNSHSKCNIKWQLTTMAHCVPITLPFEWNVFNAHSLENHLVSTIRWKMSMLLPIQVKVSQKIFSWRYAIYKQYNRKMHSWQVSRQLPFGLGSLNLMDDNMDINTYAILR